MNINDLAESRMLQERKPPGMISFFVYFLLIIMTAALLYAWFGQIEIVIKTHGTIRPLQTISRIASVVGGRVEKVFYYSGQHIEEGDVILELDRGNSVKEMERILIRINELEEKHYGLERLMESLENDSNLFTPDNLEFYHRFLHFQFKKRKLKLNLDAVEKKLHTQRNLSQFVAKSELDELDYQYQIAALELKSFVSDYFVSVSNELVDMKAEMRTLATELERLEEEIESSFIKAPIAGTVNSINDLNDGDYLFAGTEILDIIPESRGMGKVEIMLSNRDIAAIELGDAVSYRLPALPKEKFGLFNGEILSIPADKKKSDDSFFMVEGSLNRESFQNNNIDSMKLKNGMYVDVRITVRKRRIIFHLLDKLGLLPNFSNIKNY